jgi:hypothetical protein
VADDVDALRAERDELQRKVDAQSERRLRRTRGVLAVIGVVLSCVLLLASVAGIWARRSFLRTDIFSERAGDLIDDPAVQNALSTYLAGQINEIIDPQALLAEALPDQADLLAVPLSGAIEGFVADKVREFVATDTFAELWKGAVTVAHRSASRVLEGEGDIVTAEDDKIVIDLLPIINGILAEIGEQSPEIFGHTVDLPTVSVDDVPDEARDRIADALGVTLDDDFGTFTVYDDGALSTAQEALRIFNKLVWVLVVITPLVMIVSVGISPRRRRTILQLSLGAAVVLAVLRRLVLLFQEDLLDLVRIEANRPAVEVTTDAFLDPLLAGARWLAAIGLLVALIAAITGPYRWAVRTRQWVATTVRGVATLASDTAKDEATATWTRDHVDALRIVGAVVGVALLWWIDLTWARFIIVGVLIGAYELGVGLLADRAEEPQAPLPSA